ncbi:uncharacterized protein [Hyperolius riggenbachi]|uniref:uncharacterized protein n=1 Tax=Hyperolius riggenbachi TaxID=752182 RepID=UPI0035A2C7DB
MGNKNTKRSEMPQEGAAQLSKLKKEILCSICLCELTDPVTSICGHTFCRACITKHWSTTQSLWYRCPECRRICPKDQLISVYMLQNMVKEVLSAVKEDKARQSAEEEALAEMKMAHRQLENWKSRLKDRCSGEDFSKVSVKPALPSDFWTDPKKVREENTDDSDQSCDELENILGDSKQSRKKFKEKEAAASQNEPDVLRMNITVRVITGGADVADAAVQTGPSSEDAAGVGAHTGDGAGTGAGPGIGHNAGAVAGSRDAAGAWNGIDVSGARERTGDGAVADGVESAKDITGTRAGAGAGVAESFDAEKPFISTVKDSVEIVGVIARAILGSGWGGAGKTGTTASPREIVEAYLKNSGIQLADSVRDAIISAVASATNRAVSAGLNTIGEKIKGRVCAETRKDDKGSPTESGGGSDAARGGRGDAAGGGGSDAASGGRGDAAGGGGSDAAGGGGSDAAGGGRGAAVGGEVLQQVVGEVLQQVVGEVLQQVVGEVLQQVGGEVLQQVVGEVIQQVVGEVLQQVVGEVLQQVGGEVLQQMVGEVLQQVVGEVMQRVVGEVLQRVVGEVLQQVGGEVLQQVVGKVMQ